MNDLMIPSSQGMYRIGARRIEPGTDGQHVTDVNEGEEPDFYGVYLSIDGEPSQWVADYDTLNKAIAHTGHHHP
ncbi:hypothetical protein [Vreelandella jeotgali]|uniref:hypothetical protein n=1 Tax=Vreelandella jeotgali TaxID=553386 RepID=UPI00034717B0|nr:hypothetical protein [Halomonas jeotgali]